jgi:general secretion pathway protein I
MRGFTLLEVLIALLVVSVTLAAANAAIGGTAARQRGLEDRTFATWAAHSALARLRLDGFAGESTQIERTEGGRRLRVSVKVEPGDDVRQATLTVRPANGQGQNNEVLATVGGFLPLPAKDQPVPMAPMPDAAPDASDRATPGSAPPPDLAP